MSELFGLPDSLHVVLDTINRVYRTLLLLPPQASTVARRIDALQYVQVTIYTLIAVVYFGAAVYFLLRYRARPGRDHGPPVQAPLLVGGYAAAVFGLFAAFWLAGHVQFQSIRTPPSGALDVYVTAKQWTWKFAYADGGASVGVLYVPAGQPVRLLLTSRDVIHSFFVPAFRLKQDAVPGTYTTLWFEAIEPGTFPVMCTQMCGPGHSRMSAQVAVLDVEDYSAWHTSERSPAAPASDDDAAPRERGRLEAAALGCLKCHTVDGQPHIGPTWLGLFGSEETLVDGSTVLVDEAYVTESMMDPAAKIVKGFEPVMPSFQGLATPAETAAIIEYMKSLRDPRRRGGRP